MEGSLGYNVSVERGNRLINGIALTGGTGGGIVSKIDCLGASNPATVSDSHNGGYDLSDVTTVCPVNPSASVQLNVAMNGPGYTPSTAMFSPVSMVGVSLGLTVASFTSGPQTVSPFTKFH